MNTIYGRPYYESIEQALESFKKVIPKYAYLIGDVLYYGEMLNKDLSDYTNLRIGSFSHMTLEGFGNQVTLRSCDLANKLEFDMNMKVVSSLMGIRKVSYCFDIIAGDNMVHSNKFEIVTIGCTVNRIWTDLEWLIDHYWT